MVPVTPAITMTTAAVTTMSPCPTVSPLTTTSTAVERQTTKSRQNRRWITSKSSDPSRHQVDVAKKHRIPVVDTLYSLQAPLEHCERIFFWPRYDSFVCHGHADLQCANHLRDVHELGDLRVRSWVNECYRGQLVTEFPPFDFFPWEGSDCGAAAPSSLTEWEPLAMLYCISNFLDSTGRVVIRRIMTRK
jgi:hypothetical protein